MGNNEFQDLALRHVMEVSGLQQFELYVVWLSKVLRNNKAMIATTVPGDGKYYEVTYNGEKGEIYVDDYSKVSNTMFKEGDL